MIIIIMLVKVAIDANLNRYLFLKMFYLKFGVHLTFLGFPMNSYEGCRSLIKKQFEKILRKIFVQSKKFKLT